MFNDLEKINKLIVYFLEIWFIELIIFYSKISLINYFFCLWKEFRVVWEFSFLLFYVCKFENM